MLPKLITVVPLSVSLLLIPPPEGACGVLGSPRPPLAPSPNPTLSVGAGVFPWGKAAAAGQGTGE